MYKFNAKIKKGVYIEVEQLPYNFIRCLTKDIDINRDVKEVPKKTSSDIERCEEVEKIIRENLPPYLGVDMESDEYNDYDEDNNYKEDDSEEYNIHTIMDGVALIKSKSHCRDIVFYIKEGFKLENYLPFCAKKIDIYNFIVGTTNLSCSVRQILEEKLPIEKAIFFYEHNSFMSLEEAEKFKKKIEEEDKNELLLSDREKTLPKEIQEKLHKIIIKKELYLKDMLSCEVCEKTKKGEEENDEKIF